jgi:hypothetical protein
MSYLVRQDDTIRLADGWPSQDDLGRLVILPGGEAGILKRWWHAEDRSEWRWQVEFYNHIRLRRRIGTVPRWKCSSRSGDARA